MRIVIRRASFEFGGAGVDEFVDRTDRLRFESAHILKLDSLAASPIEPDVLRAAHRYSPIALLAQQSTSIPCCRIRVSFRLPGTSSIFKIHQLLHLRKKPRIDLRQLDESARSSSPSSSRSGCNTAALAGDGKLSAELFFGDGPFVVERFALGGFVARSLCRTPRTSQLPWAVWARTRLLGVQPFVVLIQSEAEALDLHASGCLFAGLP